jgi:ATP-dependent Lon protease
VLLPQQNEKDLVEVPEHVRWEMEFVGCDSVEQILQNALVPVAASANGNGHGKAALTGLWETI